MGTSYHYSDSTLLDHFGKIKLLLRVTLNISSSRFELIVISLGVGNVRNILLRKGDTWLEYSFGSRCELVKGSSLKVVKLQGCLELVG